MFALKKYLHREKKRTKQTIQRRHCKWLVRFKRQQLTKGISYITNLILHNQTQIQRILNKHERSSFCRVQLLLFLFSLFILLMPISMDCRGKCSFLLDCDKVELEIEIVAAGKTETTRTTTNKKSH